MMLHVQDILAGGNKDANPFYGSLGYYRDEERIRKNFAVRSTYVPKNVCSIEQKLYDFMEEEKIDYGISGKAPCELFVTGFNGYTIVIFAPDAEYRENQIGRLCALAHELGHYFDFKYNYDFNSFEFDSKRVTKIMIPKEVRAWKYAYDILRALGFEKWDEFLYEMKSSLNTYFEDEKETEDNVSAIRNLLRKGND